MPRLETTGLVLIRRRDLERIWAGEVTLAFRAWKRPTVKAGGSLRTPLGVLAIDEVSAVTPARVTAADARRAGYGSRSALLEALGDLGQERRLYRVALRPAGADPRLALRARARLTAAERTGLDQRLARLDAASRRGPWTEAALRAIAQRPGVRAADLAAARRWERAWFKRNVRKLKELGLTESLEVGYRLSARGRAYWRGR